MAWHGVAYIAGQCIEHCASGVVHCARHAMPCHGCVVVCCAVLCLGIKVCPAPPPPSPSTPSGGLYGGPGRP
eukprot:4158732-Lingulodinium_polyedra.AAC.1